VVGVSNCIQYLFPGIASGEYGVRNDSDGEYVEWWHRPEPQPTPEELQAAMLPAAQAMLVERIKAERLRRQLEGGWPLALPGVGRVTFHSDEHSRSQQSGLYASMTLMLLQGATMATPVMDGGKQLTWDTKQGLAVPVSLGVLAALLQGSMRQEGANHAASKVHIAAVRDLKSAEEVLAYDFSKGWPE
jgi:hypothetical protein